MTPSRFNPSRRMVWSFFVVLSTIGCGCTSSHLTNVWRDPDFKNGSMKSMLVVAAKLNPLNRHIWEDGLVAQLSAHGVTSVPSYSLFADSIPNPDQVGEPVVTERFDGILFVRSLPKEISVNYELGDVESVPVTGYSKGTRTYYPFYQAVQEPGYTDTSIIVRQELSVFATRPSVILAWTGTGEITNPRTRDAVRGEIIRLIIPELLRQGILPAE
jgi:hypothetical protein